MGTPHFSKLQHYWNLPIRFSVINRIFVGGVTSLQRNRLSNNTWGKRMMYCWHQCRKSQNKNFAFCGSKSEDINENSKRIGRVYGECVATTTRGTHFVCFYKKRTTEFVDIILALTDNDPSKSISIIARNMGGSGFLFHIFQPLRLNRI